MHILCSHCARVNNAPHIGQKCFHIWSHTFSSTVYKLHMVISSSTVDVDCSQICKCMFCFLYEHTSFAHTYYAYTHWKIVIYCQHGQEIPWTSYLGSCRQSKYGQCQCLSLFKLAFLGLDLGHTKFWILFILRAILHITRNLNMYAMKHAWCS